MVGMGGVGMERWVTDEELKELARRLVIETYVKEGFHELDNLKTQFPRIVQALNQLYGAIVNGKLGLSE